MFSLESLLQKGELISEVTCGNDGERQTSVDELLLELILVKFKNF
jgi:hypothetical protein